MDKPSVTVFNGDVHVGGDAQKNALAIQSSRMGELQAELAMTQATVQEMVQTIEWYQQKVAELDERLRGDSSDDDS